MSHTPLSRVNILHKGKVLQELCRLLFYESPGEKDRKNVVISPGRKGQEEYC